MDVHPTAALFDMLDEDELAALAADIKERGLRQPIVLDTEGRILDGRNRLAACELAGVEPEFETYEGDDPEQEAWSSNVRRRDLGKAKRAIAIAERWADKNLSTREMAAEAGTSQPMIVWAVAVQPYKDLRDAVRAGGSLKDAYDEAKQRDLAEVQRKAQEAHLREHAPDLLAIVDTGRMTLNEAHGALDVRERQAEAEAEAARLKAQAEATEAERERKQREKEDEASRERDRDRIREVINGWASVKLVMREPVNDDQRQRIKEIVEGLMPGDRQELDNIISQIRTDSDDDDR